ncbi:MAG: hypothetical protein Q4D14_02415 [Bacteroidales bacterium]|nr:hypothetical protein [Bacteroidales bacterium]
MLYRVKNRKLQVHSGKSELLPKEVDMATTNLANAMLQLESAIQQYQRAEEKLGGAVTTISNKVDGINGAISRLIKEAPQRLKLTVTVTASDADKKAILDQFDAEHKWMIESEKQHLQEVNNMFIEERQRVNRRFEECDGTWFGYRSQWFFLFFYYIGVAVIATCIFMFVAKQLGWY